MAAFWRQHVIVIVAGVKHEVWTNALDFQHVNLSGEGVNLGQLMIAFHHALLRTDAEGVPRAQQRFLEQFEDYEEISEAPTPVEEADEDEDPTRRAPSGG